MTDQARVIGDIAAAARGAWPELAGEADSFARELAARAGDAPESIRPLHLGDLFLAWCSAHGMVAAIAAHDRILVREVPKFVARTDASPAFADEVIQIVRTELLVTGSGAPPGIARYAGSGPLGGWIRVIAVRVAHRLRRARRPEVELVEAASPDRAAGDPEMEILKAHCRREFEAAVESVLRSLPDRERRILRLHYLEGRTINEIAEIFGVHRLTISRWLKAARADILLRTREQLMSRHRLAPSEVDSLIRFVQSRFDLGMVSGLATRRS